MVYLMSKSIFLKCIHVYFSQPISGPFGLKDPRAPYHPSGVVMPPVYPRVGGGNLYPQPSAGQYQNKNLVFNLYTGVVSVMVECLLTNKKTRNMAYDIICQIVLAFS